MVDCGQNTNQGGSARAVDGLFANPDALKRAFTDDIAAAQLMNCPGEGPSPDGWHYDKTPTVTGGLGGHLSPPECQGALYTTQDAVYAGSGFTGVSGLVSSEPGDSYDHTNQAVVLFPSADKAKSLLQTSVDKWKAWTFAQVQGSPPKIAVVDTQEGADGWECERAMSVANNVIVDVNACGYHISNQGDQIADKIVDKVNNE